MSALSAWSLQAECDKPRTVTVPGPGPAPGPACWDQNTGVGVWPVWQGTTLVLWTQYTPHDSHTEGSFYYHR